MLRKLGAAENYGAPLAWALFHLVVGEAEKAADWWKKVIDPRDPGAVLQSRFGPGLASVQLPVGPCPQNK
jgi:hypothetical protein